MTSDNIQFVWEIVYIGEYGLMEYLWKNFPELKDRFVSAEKIDGHRWKITFKGV